MVFCVALFLTGCATVSHPLDGNGNKIEYEDIHYNQGQVLKIGDYLYFGNGYVASDGSDFDYDDSTEYTFLSRINTSERLKFDESVSSSKWATTTPNGVEVVNDDKVFGSQLQNMFALGEYIYFAAPNEHKTKDMESDYTKVSLFRMKFDGSKVKELVKNTAFSIGSTGKLTVQKGNDGNYYYIIVEEGENSTFTIKSLKIGNKIGEINTLAENVTSYAIADENSTQKNVLFTVADEDRAMATQIIKAVDFEGGEPVEIDRGLASSTTKFVGRAGDVVFYYYKHQATAKDAIYFKHMEESDYPMFEYENEKDGYKPQNGETSIKDEHFSPADSQFFYSATTISQLQQISNGYIFKTEGGALMYSELGKGTKCIFSDTEFTDLLFTENDYVYVSNATSIKRASVDYSDSKEEIITVTDMVSGKCGYDGQYIYFYSKIEKPEEEEEDESEVVDGKKEEVIDNYYMHRVDKNGNLQLLGETLTQWVEVSEEE